jgi:hypothetical protein
MVDPLGGAAGGFDSVHHQVLKTTSMAAPLGALLAGLAASITEVEDSVDGGPLGGATGGSNNVHH